MRAKSNIQEDNPSVSNCPLCNSPMKIYGRDCTWVMLRCSKCSLDYGRMWFTDTAKLITSWEVARNRGV